MIPPTEPAPLQEPGGAPRAQRRPRRPDALIHRQRRVQLLREDATAAAAPIPDDPVEMTARVSASVRRAVSALGGCSGRLVLVGEWAWLALLPATAPRGDAVAFDGRGVATARVRDGGALHRAITGCLTVAVADTLAGSPDTYAGLARHGVRSFAISPVASPAGVLGALTVDFSAPGPLTDASRQLLEAFAAHQALLVNRIRPRLEQRRRLAQAEQLSGTLAQVGAAPDLEGALTALVRGAVSLLKGAHGLARIFDRSSPDGRLTVFAEQHADGRLDVRWHPESHILPGTFGGQLRDGGPPILVEDFWSLDPVRYPAYAAMRRQQMRSSVNVPIDAAGQRVGSLHVDHPEPAFFGPADLAAAGALAALAGSTIERARVQAAHLAAERLLESQAREIASHTAEAAALRELDRLKDEFIQSISHELRTPLTVVHGYAHQLSKRALTIDPAATARIATTLLAASTRLKRLVDDLLQHAQLDRGELQLSPQPLDLGALLDEIVSECRSQPGVERLSLQVASSQPIVALADREKTHLAIRNLVENALKYAPLEPVHIRASIPAGSSVARVEVADQGPGIPIRERSRIWERFYRGSAVAGLNLVPGSGVGLAVVKDLVEAQNGRVGLDTPPGGGACFWLELPVAPTSS